MARRHARRTRWALVGVWMGVISVGSLAPGATALPASDFAFHAGAYGILAWLMARALGARAVRLAALAAGLAWVFGFLLEVVQLFHPDRTYEARDVIANAYGVAGGVILALLFPGSVRADEPEGPGAFDAHR